MSKHRKSTPRSQKLLEKVYMALGANELRERWIDDKHGVLGLAEPGVITISPHNLIPTILHECLHRIFPENTNESSIDRMASYLYWRMSDEDCKRIWEAYASKVKRMRKPTTAE